tara:strand:+ start:303 stop:692 length:390 start_codon:yes stop_codon:yes gene_type:complete
MVMKLPESVESVEECVEECVECVEECVEESVEEVATMLVELPTGFAKPDSSDVIAINKERLIENFKIPSINLATLDLVKRSQLSKQMKKKVLALPTELTDITEGIAEVITLVESKRTLKKAIELVFKYE